MLSKFKWIFFLISGFITHLSILTLYIFCLYNYNSFKGIVLSTSLFFVWVLFSILLSSISDKFNILWFPFAIFKRRKWIYHNKLGYFLMFIDEQKIDILKVNWFTLVETISIRNSGSLKLIVKELKEKLDESFKTYLIHLQQLKEQKDNIKIVKDWDGLLIDDDERRDQRLDKILKK